MLLPERPGLSGDTLRRGPISRDDIMAFLAALHDRDDLVALVE
jgi:hypothetical protein